MSTSPTRAESVITDINSSMFKAAAAVAAGQLLVAHSIISSLHQRTTAWQHLPAHHQRRRMMDDLGMITLDHIDASFASLSSASSGAPFIEDELDTEEA